MCQLSTLPSHKNSRLSTNYPPIDQKHLPSDGIVKPAYSQPYIPSIIVYEPGRPAKPSERKIPPNPPNNLIHPPSLPSQTPPPRQIHSPLLHGRGRNSAPATTTRDTRRRDNITQRNAAGGLIVDLIAAIKRTMMVEGNGERKSTVGGLALKRHLTYEASVGKVNDNRKRASKCVSADFSSEVRG